MNTKHAIDIIEDNLSSSSGNEGEVLAALVYIKEKLSIPEGKKRVSMILSEKTINKVDYWSHIYNGNKTRVVATAVALLDVILKLVGEDKTEVEIKNVKTQSGIKINFNEFSEKE